MYAVDQNGQEGTGWESRGAESGLVNSEATKATEAETEEERVP